MTNNIRYFSEYRILSAVFFLNAVLFSVLPCFSMNNNAADSPVINSLRNKYNPQAAVRAEFSLDVFWKVREKSEHKSGVLYLAPKDRFRLELGKNIWVSDGKTFWQYSSSSSQVVVMELADTEPSILPSNIISRYIEKYSYKTIEIKDGQTILSWQASEQDSKNDTRAVTLWIDTDRLLIKKMLVTDKNGNESTYIFKKTIIGAAIPDAEFKLEIPQGASVLDKRR